MANSRKSNSDLQERVADTLHPVVPPASSIVLGLSGGLDSVVLLHVLKNLQVRFGFHLAALHVNHHISPNAEAWADFCRHLCERLSIPLQVADVNILALREKLGVEAAARQLRYAEYAKSKADLVVLAHHQDDQAETMLLQLLRGSGVRGAAAMPSLKPMPSGQPHILRPLLQIPRCDLSDYAMQHGLQWIEDESNADIHYPRNYLRHQILPLLEARFPAYRQTLTRSSSHFSEAAALMDELAWLDAQAAGAGRALKLDVVNTLSDLRGKNLLRYFIQQQGAMLPEKSRLQEMLHQLRVLRSDAKMSVGWDSWSLRCYQGLIYVVRDLPQTEVLNILPWQGEAEIVLPELGGVLSFTPTYGAGLSTERMRQQGVMIRTRQGGEVMRIWRTGHHRSLKNIFQEHHIPPWERNRMPLLFAGESLICIPNVVDAEEFCAKNGEAGVLVQWRFDDGIGLKPSELG